MRTKSVLAQAFGLERTAIEDVEERDGAIVISVRPRAKARGRCGRCQRRCRGYDQGRGRRQWRALDMGVSKVVIEADAPRVNCPEHGPTVAAVPWARHNAGHTRQFDEQVAWLAVHMSKSAAMVLMSVAWRTIGSILDRVLAEIDQGVDRLEGLRRIGIDEISYKRGHRYLTVVVDHDTGRLVWAAPGRDKATLAMFFDQLGPKRTAQLTYVSADMADWIRSVVIERAPQAVLCADPFHVVQWAMEALDVERRRAWNQASGRVKVQRAAGKNKGATGPARQMKRSRWSLLKNPENLTDHQREQLAWIVKTDPRLYRAYLLKEGLRHVFKLRGDAAKQALDEWLAWAQRSRIEAFVHLGRRIRRRRTEIEATLDHGLSNGLVESANTKIRVITRVAFGFHGPQPLIALAMLALGHPRPTLPGRA